MIKISIKGNFDKSHKFFDGCKTLSDRYRRIFERYADKGLQALKEMTPKDTGLTASKWSYKIRKNSVIYENSAENNGVHVVILLQYGHLTGNGAYVPAIDFINPALKPIFDEISMECWKEVTSL